MVAKKEARPRSVRVLGKTHSINYKPSEEMENSYGLCFNGRQRINIMEGLPGGEEADTVLHEILHAVLFQMAVLLPPDVEEQFVRPAASGLYAVLQDNPQFAKWLIQPRT
jgi:hypothetical protein